MTALAREEDRLLACVHCGLCLPVCPTYDVLGDENDSPRGRIQLMRALAEGRAGIGDAFRTHIGRCLGCRACETACPAGVEYGALLEAARSDAAEATGGPAARLRRAPGALGLWLLTGPIRRALFPLLRSLRAGGALRLAARLPGSAGLAARLLEATRPVRPGDGRARPRAAPASRDRPHPRDEPAPRDGPTYALLEGCVMGGLFGHVHRATRRTLAAAGYRERAAPGQTCCGALHAHAGFLAAARRRARRNVAAFEASGADRIAVDSAGCGAALREYPRWLADQPAWARRAEDVARRTRDVSQLLADSPRRRPGPRRRLRGRVGYDAPCHLSHGQGVRDEPLESLASIDGLEVEALPSSGRCCGGAGVYNLLHPGLSRRVLDAKLEEARAGDYDWIATGNPGCIMQIGAGLRAAGLAARAVHPVELLDASGDLERSERDGRGRDPAPEPVGWRRRSTRRRPAGGRRVGGRADESETTPGEPNRRG